MDQCACYEHGTLHQIPSAFLCISVHCLAVGCWLPWHWTQGCILSSSGGLSMLLVVNCINHPCSLWACPTNGRSIIFLFWACNYPPFCSSYAKLGSFSLWWVLWGISFFFDLANYLQVLDALHHHGRGPICHLSRQLLLFLGLYPINWGIEVAYHLSYEPDHGDISLSWHHSCLRL